MATGRDLCIFFFPFLTTVATLVLACLVFVGSYKNVPVVNDVYFLRLNFTDIDLSNISGVSSDDSEIISDIASELGISNIYDAGANGYCQGTKNGTIVDCYSPTTPYWFDLVTILEDDADTGITIDLPTDVTDYEKTLKAASEAMWICYLIGIGLTGIELLSGFFSFHSRIASCCSMLFAGIGSLFLFIASALATGIFIVYKEAFNKNFSSYGVSGSLGSKAFIITWISAAASLVSSTWWMFSICCGSTGYSHRHIDDEKEPFIGYVPHHGY